MQLLHLSLTRSGRQYWWTACAPANIASMLAANILRYLGQDTPAGILTDSLNLRKKERKQIKTMCQMVASNLCLLFFSFQAKSIFFLNKTCYCLNWHLFKFMPHNLGHSSCNWAVSYSHCVLRSYIYTATMSMHQHQCFLEITILISDICCNI